VINGLLFKFQKNMFHLQAWLKSIQSVLKDMLREPKKLKVLLKVVDDYHLNTTHLRHFSLLVYSKIIHLYLFHYHHSEGSLQNPFGVLLLLLQHQNKNGPLFQKIEKMYEIYRRVPVLSGSDKKLKKMLKIEDPEELTLSKKPLKKDKGKKYLKQKIKHFIEVTRDKRTSFLCVVHKMMNRMRKTVSLLHESDREDEALDSFEDDIDRKINEIKKKIKFGKETSQRERDINLKRLEVLEGIKQKQQMEFSFRKTLDSVLSGRPN
jgi:hypothetical protein